jgi:aryl-alcohol dehydrogenase-like predicted oxidoreductase
MMKRRDFLTVGTGAGLAGLLGPRLWAQLQAEAADPAGPVPRRALGQTGEALSVIGIGAIALMGDSQQDGDRLVAEALERGVNYADVAPSYGAGEAEEKLGPALKGRRDRLFLACKTARRDRDGAAQELRTSLTRLGTDHVDLYQMHALQDVQKDVDAALGPGGAIEAFQEARQQGLVRFLGFSAHSVDGALKAIQSGVFDTILYPLNFVCHFQGNFDQEVIRQATARGMGILALKAMARAAWGPEPKPEERPYPKCWYEPVSDPAEAALALRWTLGQGVTAAVPPGDASLFQIAMNVAAKERPLAPEEEGALATRAAQLSPIFRRNA